MLQETITPSPDALKQRQARLRQKQKGLVNFRAWITPEQAEFLKFLMKQNDFEKLVSQHQNITPNQG